MKKEYKELMQKLEKLEWLMRRYQVMNHMAHGPMGNPHRGQGRVLALLKLHPEISQKDLSHILDIRAQSLGELLSKLEKNGYITRTPSQEDRRVMMIRLTDAGAEAVQKMDQSPQEDDLFACLSDEEQAQLGTLLDRIIESLEQRYGKDEARGGHPGHHGGGRGHYDGHGCRGGFEGMGPGFDPRHMHGHMGGRGGMGHPGCRDGWGGHGGRGEEFVDFDADDSVPEGEEN